MITGARWKKAWERGNDKLRDKQIVETPKISVVRAGSGNPAPQIEPCVILLAREPARTEENLQPNTRSREALYVPRRALELEFTFARNRQQPRICSYCPE